MTPNCAAVVAAITKHPGITQAGICHEVRRSGSEVHGTLIWLVSNGHVRREYDKPNTYWPIDQ